MNRLTKYYKEKITDETFGKHVFPNIEDIVINEEYAITFNPNLQTNSFFEFHDFMTSKILPLVPHYTLYPEISHKNQKWHLHGYVRFKDQFEIVNFYMNIHVLKDLTTFKLRHVDTDDFVDCIQWYMYCRKQRHCIKPWIIRTYNGKLPYKFTSCKRSHL